jgi:hypothetical protein
MLKGLMGIAYNDGSVGGLPVKSVARSGQLGIFQFNFYRLFCQFMCMLKEKNKIFRRCSNLQKAFRTHCFKTSEESLLKITRYKFV